MERRYSRKREAILAAIKATDCHPSAEWIYNSLKVDIPDLSLGTVYRNIALFKEEGSVVTVGTVDGQERLDGFTDPHVHFICTKCGAVLDVYAPMPDAAALITQIGGRIDGYQLSFYGLCSACLESGL